MSRHPLLTSLLGDVAAGRKVLADLRGIRAKLEADIGKIDARFNESARTDAAGTLRGAAHAEAQALLGATDIDGRLRSRASEAALFDKLAYFATGRFESPAARSPALRAADGTSLVPVLSDADRLVSARLGAVVESIEALRWQVSVARLTTRALRARARDCIRGGLWGVLPVLVAEADFRAESSESAEMRGLPVELRRDIEAIDIPEFTAIEAAFGDCDCIARWIGMVSREIADGPPRDGAAHEDVREEQLVALRRQGADNDTIRAMLRTQAA